MYCNEDHNRQYPSIFMYSYMNYWQLKKNQLRTFAKVGLFFRSGNLGQEPATLELQVALFPHSLLAPSEFAKN